MATVLSAPEQRVVLNVSWETYESLLADHLDCSSPRFTYDCGVLEIMSPSSEHEKINRCIALLVDVLAEELDLDVENLGSTTFRREDLKRGFEPDSCFYIQNVERVRGKKKIDLTIDPPPDLVIEIDITSESLNKLPIYAKLGVPEIWRYQSARLIILTLADNSYSESDESLVLPGVTGQAIFSFVADSQSLKRPEWLKNLRAWARGIRL
jgi:Uma2 family endonuclease